MTRKQSQPPLRIGIDFGFGFTGVALLDDDSRVLERAAATHRTRTADISQALQERRANRAMRRRVRSRRKRLRDFRALLKEMGFPPVLPAPDEEAKARPGNRLYAVAHWRGWDYAELAELLMEQPDDDAPPRPARMVREIDDFLKEQEIFPVPASRLKRGRPPKPARRESRDSKSFRDRQGAWEQAGKALENGDRPGADLLRWAELEISCLGGLAEAVCAARDAAERADANPDDDDLLAAAERARDESDSLRETLNGDDPEKISAWIEKRLDLVFGEIPKDRRGDLLREIMVRLGLADGREPHRAGKLYAPGRNRHRAKALDELREKLRKALRDAGRGDEYEKWKSRAEKILRDQRPKRVDNRKPGKCRALDAETGGRCKCNVPRRDHPEIRRILFETAARQMKIRPDGAAEFRELDDGEFHDLLACADFEKGEVNGEKWRDFFKRFPTPPAKRDEDGEALRTMRDQLRDIVRSGGKGRTALCRTHMAEKLQLLKDGQTESDRWQEISGERVLSRADAKPSLLHRADKICAEVRRMLAAAGFPDPRQAPLAHVGVESARFDIAALSAAEGRKMKKMKKSAYGKKRGRSRHAMARAQGDLCVFCGETLGADVTVDHVFARARRGGDAHKNRAAMCAACNTQKWKLGEVKLNPDALRALAENDPTKAEFLQALARGGEKIASEANLAAAQATMFGAKIIRGMLAEMLIGDLSRPENAKRMREIFPVQRAADLARVREKWFPAVNRQKRALRARVRDDEKNSGDAVVLQVGDDPKEIPGVLQNPDRPKPACLSVPAPGRLKITPAPGSECVETVWLERDDSRTLKILPSASRAKRGPWTFAAAGECEINLREQKIRGKLAAVDDEADPEKWPFAVLSRGDGILRIRADSPGECKLRFSGWPLRIVVRPAKDDPVRKYHHAVDAVVAAARVDWAKIARMARDAGERGERANAAFAQAIQNARPLDRNGKPFPDAAPPPEQNEWLLEDSISESGTKRSKTKREPWGIWKNPDDPDAPILVQRCRLDRLTRGDLKKITPAADEIRRALESAWAEIDSLPEEQREKFVTVVGTGPNKKECIAAEWFLQKRREAWAQVNALPPERRAQAVRVRTENRGGDDERQTEFIREKWFREDWENRAVLFLDPLRVRSVPLQVGANPRSPFAVRRRGVLHRFNRVEHWGEVVLWKNPDGTLDCVRRRPPFYRNRDNREWETEKRDGEWVEKKPPQDAEEIARFKRGDTVRIEGIEGCDQTKRKIKAEVGQWRVTKLGETGATLVALDDDARKTGKAEKFRDYRALRRA